MKANEIIYAIREKLKENKTDDTNYTDDYIMYLVRLHRALLIRREYSNMQRSVDSEIMQTFIMPLEEVNSEKCPDCTSFYNDEECYIMRSVDIFPYTIELHNKNMIYRIAIHDCKSPTLNKTRTHINYVSSDRAIYSGSGDFEFNKIFAFNLPDGHLYLKSTSGIHRTIEAIAVSIVAEDPDELSRFTSCVEDKPCFNIIEDRYPVKAWMEKVIIDSIVSELVPLKELQPDKINNATADTN